MRIEPALEDKGGGELVDDASAHVAAGGAIGRVVAGGLERGVDLCGGETLVPEMNGEAGVLPVRGVIGCLSR